MGISATFRITTDGAEAVDVYLDNDDDGVLCIVRQGEDRIHLPSSEAAEEMGKCLLEMATKLRRMN